MVGRRNALGRGLGALIPPPPASPPVAARASGADDATSADTDLARELPIASIAPNPEQPRRQFDEAELAQLAASIGRHGVLQPVVVRRARDAADGRYELVVGERRWRASKLAGRTTIPARILDVDPRSLLEVALVENIQRRDLNPIELAQAFRTLADGGATQEEVGAAVGLDRSTIANHLRLLELPRELQGDVESGRLSMGHAKALLQVANPERRRHLRDRIVAEGLPVRAAEELARRLSAPVAPERAAPRKTAQAVDPNLRDLVETLQSHLQTRVRIQGEGARGRIEIEFYGPEELHRLTRSILEGRRI